MTATLGGTWFNLGQALLFFLLWLVLWLPLAALVSQAVHWKLFQPIEPPQKIPLVLSLYAIAPLALYFVLRWHHLSWGAIGLQSTQFLGTSFWTGLLFGLGSFLALFGFYTGVGWADWKWGHPPSVCADQDPKNHQDGSSFLAVVVTTISLILATLLLSGIVGFTEELVFRGFLTSRLTPFLNMWQAGTITSAIFALLHLVWDGKEGIPQLPGLWLMGNVLTVAWWADHQSISMAWGLHSGWVWAIATVDALGLIHYRKTAPHWGIGINRQPLASIPGIVALMAVGIWLGYVQLG